MREPATIYRGGRECPKVKARDLVVMWPHGPSSSRSWPPVYNAFLWCKYGEPDDALDAVSEELELEAYQLLQQHDADTHRKRLWHLLGDLG